MEDLAARLAALVSLAENAVADEQTLTAHIRGALTALREEERGEALSAAARARLQPKLCLSLLRRGAGDDLTEAAGQLLAVLTGHGEHAVVLAAGGVRLRLRSADQGTGTGTRVWRSALLAIEACA